MPVAPAILGFPIELILSLERGVPVAPRFCPPSAVPVALQSLVSIFRLNEFCERGVPIAPRSCSPSVLTEFCVRVAVRALLPAPQARYKNRYLGSLAGTI